MNLVSDGGDSIAKTAGTSGDWFACVNGWRLKTECL